MSTVASFYVIPAERLPVIIASPVALDIAGQELDDAYDWQGEAMLALLHHLDATGVPVLTSKYDAEAEALNKKLEASVLLTAEHKAYLDRIDPDGYDEDELGESLRELMDAPGFDDAGAAGIDGLRALFDGINGLSDDEVLVVHIG